MPPRACSGFGPCCGRTKPPALTSGPLSARPAPSAGGAAPCSHPGQGTSQEPAASRQASSPAKPARSPARARARPTCKLVPPALPSPGSPRPSRLSPAMGKRTCWPRATATATASSPRPPTLRWGPLGHLRHEAQVGGRRMEVGGARRRCPQRPGARPCLILGA